MKEQNKDGSLTTEYLEHLKSLSRCKKVGTEIITSYLINEVGESKDGFLLDFDLSFDKKMVNYVYQDKGTEISSMFILDDFLTWLCI